MEVTFTCWWNTTFNTIVNWTCQLCNFLNFDRHLWGAIIIHQHYLWYMICYDLLLHIIYQLLTCLLIWYITQYNSISYIEVIIQLSSHFTRAVAMTLTFLPVDRTFCGQQSKFINNNFDISYPIFFFYISSISY